MDINLMWGFIRQNWLWLLVTYPFACVAGYLLWWHMYGRREYKEVDGKIFIKEGIGEWEEMEYHLKSRHHLNQAEINDLMLEARVINREREKDKRK